MKEKPSKTKTQGSLYQDLLQSVAAVLRVPEMTCTNSPLIIIILRDKTCLNLSVHVCIFPEYEMGALFSEVRFLKKLSQDIWSQVLNYL